MKISLILFAFIAVAAETKAPEITAEHRAKYWRLQAEAIAMQVQAQRAQAALQAMQGELEKVCGKDSVLTNDERGEPACQAKAEQPKK